jgi:hypothetical protein
MGDAHFVDAPSHERGYVGDADIMGQIAVWLLGV